MELQEDKNSFLICLSSFFACFFNIFDYSICQYELTLVASDSLNENSTKVVLHVNDVNDLPPVFDRSIYEETVWEEMPGPKLHRLLKVDFK